MKKCGFIVLALALLASLCGCTAGEGEASQAPEGLWGIPIDGETVNFEVNYVFSDTGYAFLAVRFLEEEHYIGCALILIDDHSGSVHFTSRRGTVIMSEYFPEIDGEYKDITREELDAAVTVAMEEYEARIGVSGPDSSPAPEEPDEGENITFEIWYADTARPSTVRPELMEVRLREGERYAGYALIMLGLPDRHGNYGGEIIMSKELPKVDGEYQDITEEELDAAIAAAVEEYRAKKAEERGG